MLLLGACFVSSCVESIGSEGEPCNRNALCGFGLVCESGFCEADGEVANSADSGVTVPQPDSGVLPDVGIAPGTVELAAWSFSGDLVDESGRGNDGTAVGAIFGIDRLGSASSALVLAGNGEHVDIGTAVKPAFPFTFNLWLRVDAEATGFGMGVIRNDEVNSRGFRWGAEVRITQTQALYMSVYDGFAAGGTRRDAMTEGGLIAVGRWHMVTVAFNGLGSFTAYVDGRVAMTTAGNGTGASLRYSSGSGAIGMGDRTIQSFVGMIDDVRIFEGALSEADVAVLFDG